MSTTQGSPKRLRTEPDSESENNDEYSDCSIILPYGYTFTDRCHCRSHSFWVEEGLVHEIEIIPGYTPKSLMELKGVYGDCLSTYSSVYIWVNDGAYVYFTPSLEVDEEKIMLFLGINTVWIASDDDEAAQKAMAFILDLPRDEYDDDDGPKVQIETSLVLHQECLQSIFRGPHPVVEFVHAVLTAEACNFIFANGSRLSFISCHFDDEGQAMMEALKQRSEFGNLSLQIGLDESFDDVLPMSDLNFKALLDRKGEDPIGALTIAEFAIKDTWADAISKANVHRLSLINCNFEGTNFGETLARNQASGVGPRKIEIDVHDLCLVPFFKSLETNQHLIGLKLHFIRREYAGWEVVCHSLAKNDRLKDIELSFVRKEIEILEHFLYSITHSTSIKTITIYNCDLPITWLCTKATEMLAKNHTIEEFNLLAYGMDEHGRVKNASVCDLYGLFEKTVAPYLTRNVMESRIRVLKDKNASPALVGAALAKVSANERISIKASLLWLLLSEYSYMVASQFSPH